MAFTRSFLKTMGLSEEQVQAIIDAHLEVVNPIKEQRDQYKADAEKLPGVTKERDDYKAELDKGGEDYKAKYDTEHQAFEDYKAQVKAEAEQARVKAEYRKLLTEEKISEKRLDAVIRLTDFSGMKLDKDGKLENADSLRKAIQTDWADYIQTAETKGAKVDNPPKTDTSTFDSMTLADKMAYANQHPTAPEVIGWLKK